MTPAVFDAAMSGNTELLFTVLENGDDVNPLVGFSIAITGTTLIYMYHDFTCAEGGEL